MTLRVLDLFSGIGGFSLGLERAGMRTVAFCEIDPYCRRVLAKHWPGVPIHEDIRALDGRAVAADVVCGGFPCQPFSHAGKRRGAADDRHLWPEMRRVIAEVRPAWVVGENVVGIIGMELDTVLSDLEALGYACRTFVVPAAAVDAPHLRRRVWVVARDANGNGESTLSEHAKASWVSRDVSYAVGIRPDSRAASADGGEHVPDELGLGASGEEGRENVESGIGGGGDVGDAVRQGLQGSGPQSVGANGQQSGRPTAPASRWLPEPAVGRVAHGIPHGVDRLRALGNAVVPQIPEMIGRAILEAA